MLVLAIDSASSACGVCVWRDGDALAAMREKMQRGQDARLLPMVVEAMRAAGIDYAQLDLIAVTRGPGSFTGLRVGLAAARGIGIAAGKKVAGIDRFAAWRHLNQDAGNLMVVLESKRADLFCQLPDGATRLMTQADADAYAQNHGLKIIGDIAEPDADILPVCAELASLGVYGEATPLYLREADVTLPRSPAK